MKILLTGATGLIGHSVLRHAIGAGHTVFAAVRSDRAAATVAQSGATPLPLDLFASDPVTDALKTVDAAIHLASPGDATTPDMDTAVVEAVVRACSGTDTPYIHTGGVWVHGPGDDLTEETPFAPPALTAWRSGPESTLLDSDVRSTIIEPGIVHRDGLGIPATIIQAPRTDDGRLRLVGDGSQHWTTVHADDLASLYLLVLDQGSGFGRLLGVSGHNPTVRELGEAAASASGATGVAPQSRDETAERLGGPFTDALLLDQQSRGEKARSLGWTPSQPTLLEEIAEGTR